jgi:hypothetical protein
MPYLVDGHNLIPKIPGMSLKMLDDENHLIEVLQVFCRQQQKDVEVFFDRAPAGSAPKKKFGRLTVHFVRQGRSADSAIYERLRKLGGDARNWTVVSSDRAVQASARQEHAQAIDSEIFARQLAQGDRTAKTGSDRTEFRSTPEEVNEWLEVFKKSPRGGK